MSTSGAESFDGNDDKGAIHEPLEDAGVNLKDSEASGHEGKASKHKIYSLNNRTFNGVFEHLKTTTAAEASEKHRCIVLLTMLAMQGGIEITREKRECVRSICKSVTLDRGEAVDQLAAALDNYIVDYPYTFVTPLEAICQEFTRVSGSLIPPNIFPSLGEACIPPVSDRLMGDPWGSECWGCSRSSDLSFGTLKRCGNCKRAKYCDKLCQQKDWVYHKSVCNRLKEFPGVHGAALMSCVEAMRALTVAAASIKP